MVDIIDIILLFNNIDHIWIVAYVSFKLIVNFAINLQQVSTILRSCAVAIITVCNFNFMASSLKQNKMYYKYKIMCMVSADPNVTYRQIAEKIDISTGAAYNLMTSLISQGAVYIDNLNKKKTRKIHCYKLSNIGIREKAILSRGVLEFKKAQLIQIKNEIRLLELEVSSKFESKDN